MRKKIANVILLFYIAVNYFYLLPLLSKVSATTALTSAKVTLSNSRFSYHAKVGTAPNAGDTIISISTSGQSDNDTNNIFPKDTLCVHSATAPVGGCIGVRNYTVNSIPSSSQIGFTPALVADPVTTSDYVVSTQAARMTVTFAPNTGLGQTNSYIRVTIPATSTSNEWNDGMPDQTGFDSNKLTTSNINANITPTGFTVGGSTLTSSSGSHVILMRLTSTLTSGTEYSFVVGGAADSTLRFINPSPSGTSHTRGVADTYSIVVQTEDSANTALDNTTVKVAPIDGVLVSATVEMTISYAITAVANTQSVCGFTTTAASTASTVPFGSLVNINTFYNMAQIHTVSTNAVRGYSLTVQSDGVLTKSDDVSTTIADTTCDGASCNTTTPGPWLTATNNGLGYSIVDKTGSDAIWVAPTSYYRPFSTSPIEIMANAGAASGKEIYTCYRVSVSGTQKTGYYLNKLTYIATPRF